MVGVNTDTNVVTMVSRDFSYNADTNAYRLILPNTGNTSYAYDANGNMISNGGHTFEYDAVNRLVAVVNGTLRSEFMYDANDRRVQILEKNGGTVTSKKRFLWVGNEIAEERDSTGNTVVKRFFAQGGQIGQSKYFYTKDHLGSFREITDSTGAVVVRYDYDPFGTRVKVFGSGEADFGFTGHYFHGPSGLYLTKYRAYNSRIGLWISRDPIAERGGMNLYGYVGNNPINKIDPLGLWEVDIKFGFGPAGTVTFGHNNGQTNVGFGMGVGYGGSFGFTPADSDPNRPAGSDPCYSGPSFRYGVEASGGVGVDDVGVDGGFGTGSKWSSEGSGMYVTAGASGSALGGTMGGSGTGESFGNNNSGNTSTNFSASGNGGVSFGGGAFITVNGGYTFGK